MEARTTAILPKSRDLSRRQLGFLNEHFTTRQDLPMASDLFNELINDSAVLDSSLVNLQRNLTKCIVSWISCSFRAKLGIDDLILKLQNVCLHTSERTGSKKTQNALDHELLQLAKEMAQIENIRKYVETTLQLEALVGDLEDAVFYVVSWRTGNRFSAVHSHSSTSTGNEPKEEKLLHAIKSMNDVEDVLVNVVKFHPQWSHLLKSADSRVDKTLAVLRPQVLADHRALLASLGWPPPLLQPELETGQIPGIPNPLVLMQGEKRKRYSQSFLTLCALQHLQTRREKRLLNLLGQEEHSVGLWAIDELVSPIASRMEHHFSKWVDHPEFMFALVYKTTRDFIVGVDEVLQPLIDRARLVSCSAKEAWVSAMVQTLSGFLARRIFSALAEGYKEKHMKSEVISTWLHLIATMAAFSKQMQSLLHSESSLFLLESDSLKELSRGISVFSIFCDRPDWHKLWAKIELKDAWKKLKSELKNEKAWLTYNKYGVRCSNAEDDEYLLSTREDYKAPLIAECALKIAWEMIERGQTLPDILPRIQFIRSTAARFFWHFFNVLVFRCKRIEFPSENPDDGSILRSCGSINAARYVASNLQEWSDDVNFLEMKIAENDSCLRKKGSLDDSCFFSEEIKSLAELETNWLVEIISILLRQFETLSSEYFQNKESLENVSSTIDLVVSDNFVEALDALRSHLIVLKMNLNPKDFLDSWRSIADGLDHFISRSILTSDIQFSDDGVNQFVTDMHTLFLVFQPLCARPEAFFPCIRDSLWLLKMNKDEVRHFLLVSSTAENGTKYLRSCGILRISFDRVYNVLRNRKFKT